MINPKLLLYTSCTSAVIADMLMVWWSKHIQHPLWAAIIAIILNSVGIVVWCYSMRYGIESATAITVYALFTMAGCTLLGCYVFHEQLSGLNWIGICLAVIALVLISI